IFFFFFFFQAEDGIRDFHVTGVQTCALPIFCMTMFLWRFQHNSISWQKKSQEVLAKSQDISTNQSNLMDKIEHTKIPHLISKPRSEERRVGKECKSRWARAH